MTHTLALAVVMAAGCLGVSTPASAQELPHDWVLDGSVIGGGAATWIALEWFKLRECRWCAVNSDDDRVRDALKWSNHDAAAIASDILLGGFPVLAMGVDATLALHDERWRAVGVDALVIVEAAVLAADASQVAKILFARQRPCARFPEEPPHRCNGHPASDDNVSFFSGHASATMALAVASGTVAQLRGYRWAPAAWATLPPLALMTGYLRVAADEHWWTDFVAGAVVGAVIGAAVPYFFHHPASANAPPAPTSSSALLAPFAIAGSW